jgi:hypothetical protein
MFALDPQVANPTADVAVEDLLEGMVVREYRRTRNGFQPVGLEVTAVRQGVRFVDYALDSSEVRTLARGHRVTVL